VGGWKGGEGVRGGWVEGRGNVGGEALAERGKAPPEGVRGGGVLSIQESAGALPGEGVC